LGGKGRGQCAEKKKRSKKKKKPANKEKGGGPVRCTGLNQRTATEREEYHILLKGEKKGEPPKKEGKQHNCRKGAGRGKKGPAEGGQEDPEGGGERGEKIGTRGQKKKDTPQTRKGLQGRFVRGTGEYSNLKGVMGKISAGMTVKKTNLCRSLRSDWEKGEKRIKGIQTTRNTQKETQKKREGRDPKQIGRT